MNIINFLICLTCSFVVMMIIKHGFKLQGRRYCGSAEWSRRPQELVAKHSVPAVGHSGSSRPQIPQSASHFQNTGWVIGRGALVMNTQILFCVKLALIGTMKGSCSRVRTLKLKWWLLCRASDSVSATNSKWALTGEMWFNSIPGP